MLDFNQLRAWILDSERKLFIRRPEVLESRTEKALSPEPVVSCVNAQPAKRSEKGYGDENAVC